MTQDRIQIRGLRATTHVGVPEEERAEAQTLELHLTLEPQTGFDDLGDDFSRTVDYDATSRLIRQVVAERPRQLIETVAEDVATRLLDTLPLRRVAVEVRKFILPGVDWVSVTVERPRSPAS